MSERYGVWLSTVAMQEGVFVTLAMGGLAIAAAWVGLEWVGEEWRPYIKRMYLAGGVILMVVSVVWGAGL